MSPTPPFRPAAVIPVYNHGHAVGAVVARVRAHGLHCVLVDDGSEPGCAAVLDALAQAHGAGVTLVRLASNQGKGAAMIAGLRVAAHAGWTHALQMDADGQHDTLDIPAFLDRAQSAPTAVVCGVAVHDGNVPLARLAGRWATRVCVRASTLSRAIRDATCGFRVYPLAQVLPVLDEPGLGHRMDFDPELLVRLHWRGVAIVNVRTRIAYPSDGLSHFRPGLDDLRATRMHARLLLGMLTRAARLLRGRSGPR
jgi:glycosyltransferase involved in cell wall biosynthesis